MGPDPRRFAIVAAALWLEAEVGGPAEAGITLQTPPGLNPGDPFRFVFATDGIRGTTSAAGGTCSGAGPDPLWRHPGIDGDRPDRANFTGAVIALVGFCMMITGPGVKLART